MANSCSSACACVCRLDSWCFNDSYQKSFAKIDAHTIENVCTEHLPYLSSANEEANKIGVLTFKFSLSSLIAVRGFSWKIYIYFLSILVNRRKNELHFSIIFILFKSKHTHTQFFLCKNRWNNNRFMLC